MTALWRKACLESFQAFVIVAPTFRLSDKAMQESIHGRA